MPDDHPEGFATMTQFPMRDEGTNAVSHRTEPETFESSADSTPTGLVDQADNVTFESVEHLDPPTGAAEQVTEPVTVESDYPLPKRKAKPKAPKSEATAMTESTQKESDG